MRHSGEMVKAAMKERGVTQVELARRIGKDQTLISRYVSGQIEVSVEVARSIAEVLEIDFEGLRRQLQRDKFERRREHLKAEFRDVIGPEDEIRSISGGPALTVGRLEIMREIRDTLSIPLLDFVPIGAHDISEEKTESFILQPFAQAVSEGSFALRVNGEDLTDGQIDEGDIVVVDPGAEMQNGDRVLAILGGKPALRKVYRAGEIVVLQTADNRQEPVVLMSQEEGSEIVGKVVLCAKYFAPS